MINHARTLLLNLPGQPAGYSDGMGEEFIPPEYASLKLPSALLGIRQILFGPNPDRTYLNYSVRKYLAVLHSTELLQFVTDLDSRITYSLDDTSLFPDSAWGLVSPAASLHVVNELGSPDTIGRCFHQWSVTVSDGSIITVTRQTQPAQESEISYTTAAGGWSTLVPLSGSNAYISVIPDIGNSWLLSGYARPTKELGDTQAELASYGHEYLLSLFGIGTPLGASEPFTTFYNLWNHHKELPYRLGGLLCAFIYQLERLRTRPHG